MNKSGQTAVVAATWSKLADRKPVHALVANVDLVVIRYDEGAGPRLWSFSLKPVLPGGLDDLETGDCSSNRN